MFLVTSIAMLRERTTGTLARLITLPLAKVDLLAGYALALLGMALGLFRQRLRAHRVLGRRVHARPRLPAVPPLLAAITVAALGLGALRIFQTSCSPWTGSSRVPDTTMA